MSLCLLLLIYNQTLGYSYTQVSVFGWLNAYTPLVEDFVILHLNP